MGRVMNKSIVTRVCGLLGYLVLVVCCSQAFAQKQVQAEPELPAESEAVVILRHCGMEYDQSTLLSAQFASLLQEKCVELGQRVKAGEVLGRLYDDVARAELDMNSEEANSDAQIQVAKAEYARAVVSLKKTEALGRKNFVSEEELNADRFSVEKAQYAVKQAELKQRIAKISARRAEAELRNREFVSPHDGIVVGAFKNEGESVQVQDPVFRVVNNDQLKIWGALNVTDLWRVKVGQKVRVRTVIAGSDLPVEQEVFLGQVAFIDTEVDPETQTCKILARIKNRDGQLRAGFQGVMEILPAGDESLLSRKEKP